MALKDNRTDDNDGGVDPVITGLTDALFSNVSTDPVEPEPLPPPVTGDDDDGKNPQDPPADDTKNPEPPAPTDDPELPEDAINYKEITSYFGETGILDIDEEFLESNKELAPDSPEFLQKGIDYSVQKRIEEYKAQFEHPLSQRFLEFLENGGDPSKFIEVVSGAKYSNIKAEDLKTNTALQKEILTKGLEADGLSPEEIQDTLEVYEERGIMDVQASLVHKKLLREERAQDENLVAAQRQARENYEQERLKGIEDLKADINKRNSIGEFELTPKAKAGFIDYLTKTDPKTKMTGLQKDAQDADKQLLMAYLYYAKFDFKTLAKKVESEAVDKLKANLQNIKAKTGTPTQRTTRDTGKGYDSSVLEGFAK